MANRHLSRSIVLQSLFEWDFRNYDISKAKAIFVRNMEEFAPGLGDFSFMEQLVESLLSKRADLDKIIEKAAPDWPIDKISIVDRNILRIGLYELLFSDRAEVPAKVAINEAIELAKTFGGENSSKFINGVLGSVYKEIGEPGKDSVSKKKLFKNVPYEEMPIEKLGGAVVYANDGSGQLNFAFVHDIFGHWTLPKGHITLEEGDEVGTERVVQKEIGLVVKAGEKLGNNEYIASDPEKGKLRKQVIYYLAKTDYDTLVLDKTSGGLNDLRWFPLSEIAELNLYNDILPLVTKAITLLTSK
jgi:N utilization substance protein B